MRMLLDGRLADAERVSAEALRLGLKVQSANAEQAHLLQTLALRREQGRLGELEDIVARCLRRYPASRAGGVSSRTFARSSAATRTPRAGSTIEATANWAVSLSIPTDTQPTSSAMS